MHGRNSVSPMDLLQKMMREKLVFQSVKSVESLTSMKQTSALMAQMVVKLVAANTITISNAVRPGTGQNKASISSSLMLGLNSAGEGMPIHIMFMLKAKEESNYQINPEWII